MSVTNADAIIYNLPTMPNQETQYQAADRIATVTLDRPDKLNAWTAVMEHEVRAAMAATENDENIRVIVLTGAGRGFYAGADMSLLSTVAEKESTRRNGRRRSGLPVGSARASERIFKRSIRISRNALVIPSACPCAVVALSEAGAELT
jgi:1,4-dihydroxy-2-naphthoyl-CoA synthase